MTVEKENYWDTISEWSDPSVINAEYCGHTDLYEKISKECEEFNGWTHTFDGKYFSDELKYNLTTLSGSEMDRWEFLERVQFSKQGEGLAEDGELNYWWTVPQKEDFPTVHKFMEENPQYINPVLSKLGPGDQLLPHNHGPAPQYLYNMAIDEPEGAKFAVYPTGVIHFNPGDIYKLYANNDHAVINGNKVRYHLLFRGGRV